jgi:hypothetical protein
MTPPRTRASITPATKVAELLESWPELEEVLIAQAPAFRRLKNPVLRRTVARVATLEQAAGVGGVPVRELVAALRRAAGVEAGEDGSEEREADGASSAGDGSLPGAEPGWIGAGRVVATLDADELLDAGEVPLARVNARARELRGGELLRIDSGFRPAPLLDALGRQGYRTFVRRSAPGRFETLVARSDAPA